MRNIKGNYIANPNEERGIYMVFFELDYIHELVKEAADFSNKSAKRVIFDPALIKTNIAQDVMALTAYAACADGEITKEELVKINKLLDEFGYGLTEAECDEVLQYTRVAPFEPPKTLMLLKHKAMESVKGAGNAAKVVAAFEELKIGRVILAYANIMRCVAAENSFKACEKQSIINYIENCINYVESFFGKEFRKYCDYKPLLMQQNFTPLYSSFDGEVLHVNVTAGKEVTYNALFAIVVSNNTSYNILSNAHGTVHKLNIKNGDHIKKGDLLAIIAMS